MIKENGKAIYLQIVDTICRDILSGYLPEEERIPSVREYASRVEVNPNTVMRAYDTLSDLGIIYNKRGLGYFLAQGAKEIVYNLKMKELTENALNEIFEELRLLSVTPEKLKQLYETYLSNNRK